MRKFCHSQGLRLNRPIADSLGHIISLEVLDLSNNNLSGPIPKSLEVLSYLTYLNLSFNHLRLERRNSLCTDFGLEGLVSTRIDVYSFGIILMETFSRMKPSDEIFKEDLTLKNWIEESLPNATVQVIDGNLLRQQDEHFSEKLVCVSMIFKLALSCCTECPQDRINIKEVVAALKKIKRQLDTLSDT
ncbi:unnamed protein product [Coffea canephora]|uniref:Serine-threonine/tyrosine-protein kinase catalytic domain-containing protein n=1 Tax=Coffea canephora TaxID=49390 RepID=A0A068TN97_COFCA|nr:unnamed protein product [Coffea canephora]